MAQADCHTAWGPGPGLSERPAGGVAARPVGVTGPDSALAQGAAGRGSLACGRPLPNSHADCQGSAGPAGLARPAGLGPVTALFQSGSQ
jgi:hypothetical protein